MVKGFFGESSSTKKGTKEMMTTSKIDASTKRKAIFSTRLKCELNFEQLEHWTKKRQ